MKRLNKQGFSMIELLVVLLIIGILAAVAAPLFLSNTTKAKVSEAIAGCGAIRTAERNYASLNSNGFLAITVGEGGSYFGTQTGNQSSVLGVQLHGNKYFSPDAYSVAVGSGLAWDHTPTGVTLQTPVDFLITVTGTNSVPLSATDSDGASALTAASNPVANWEVQMDNSGQSIYYDGTAASQYSS